MPSKYSTILNKTRGLNSTDEVFLIIITLSSILPVASMPNDPDDVNVSAAQNELSTEDAERVWKNKEISMTDNEILHQH